jgi:hypothetical protein
VEEKRVELIACHQAAKRLQPADGPLHDPAAAKAPQRAAVLRGGSLAAAAMRTDQLDAALGQAIAQRIAVRGPVLDQTTGLRRGPPHRSA